MERHIAALGLRATILRPTFFISNFEHIGPQWQDGELVLTLAMWVRHHWTTPTEPAVSG
ncbi:hypothetical protein [Streptomyces sp. NPDC059398]|uniref:hypothetical protein n=1 Tax=Streptomyces sp. NPDC059398 TaxID=3346820 RepID=UPI003682A4F2